MGRGGHLFHLLCNSSPGVRVCGRFLITSINWSLFCAWGWSDTAHDILPQFTPSPLPTPCPKTHALPSSHKQNEKSLNPADGARLEHWRRSQSWLQWRLWRSPERTFWDLEWPGKASQRSCGLNWAGKPDFSVGQWEGWPRWSRNQIRRREAVTPWWWAWTSASSREPLENEVERGSRKYPNNSPASLKTSVASELSPPRRTNGEGYLAYLASPPLNGDTEKGSIQG